MSYRPKRAAFLLLLVPALVFPLSCAGTPGEPVPAGGKDAVPVYGYRVVNAYRHDSAAFTQGLAFVDGWLYEGTGLHGHSTLRRVELQTGEVRRLVKLPGRYFGEGVTVSGDRVIQLTWQAGTGFVYDRESFARLEEFHYETEGWGITGDGENLIMSDGSAVLRFLNPETFRETRRVEVSGPDGPVSRLNELEYVRGEIYANVWQTDRIVRIDPGRGQITGWIDLGGLLSRDEAAGADVLNGIAYDRNGERLFVTGKLWPWLFEIELVPSGN